MGVDDKTLIRVAAVDDHPVVLRGLSAASQGIGTHRLVCVTATVQDLLARRPTEVDVVLLDLNLRDGSRPRDNVVELLEAGARVLVYTEGGRAAWIADALRAGAHGLVLKSQPLEELARAVSAVAAGNHVISAEIAEIMRMDALLRPVLTPREEEALRLVALGLGNKQVATAMGITQDTVKDHLKHVRGKYEELGRRSGSRVELSRRAAEDGIIEQP
ncbi:MAG: LuxR C-terminal-related transcriptional regulator [Nocardioides sp.]